MENKISNQNDAIEIHNFDKSCICLETVIKVNKIASRLQSLEKEIEDTICREISMRCNQLDNANKDNWDFFKTSHNRYMNSLKVLSDKNQGVARKLLKYKNDLIDFKKKVYEIAPHIYHQASNQKGFEMVNPENKIDFGEIQSKDYTLKDLRFSIEAQELDEVIKMFQKQELEEDDPSKL